jgi:hypothetical protein
MATVFQCDRCSRVDDDKALVVKVPCSTGQPESFEICHSCVDELARWMRQTPKAKRNAHRGR